MAEKWLTPREAARLWRVHPRTIVRWIKDERIEGCQFGARSYRVYASDEEVSDHGEVQGQEKGRERVVGEER